MPNLLAIPFKKTYALTLRQAVNEHVQAQHPGTHPEEFKWDVGQWETLRREAMLNTAVNLNRVKALLTYARQFLFGSTWI